MFNTCLSTGKFPLEWKKANIVPIHKKGDKQAVINYRSLSLLPICRKIFERLLYNKMLNFFLKKDLISPKHSGFRPGDSCIWYPRNIQVSDLETLALILSISH